MDVLEGMFYNVVCYLKLSGRSVGVRDADPRSPALKDDKYGGGTCRWIKDFPVGVKYLCVLH